MASKKQTAAPRKKTAAAKKPQNKVAPAGDPESAAAAKTAPAAADPLPAIPAADYVFAPKRDSKDHGQAAPGLSFEIADRPEGGAIARIAGGDPAAVSAGRTGGWSIQVPDSFEAAASGKAVRISVCARAANGAASAAFDCAYSTNEVGNSGWRRFAAGPGWRLFTFNFNVNPMVKGKGDFIGILPAPAGAPGIEIGFIAAQVIERPAPPAPKQA